MRVLVVKPHMPLPATQGTRRLTLGLLEDLKSAFEVSFLCLLEDRAEAAHVAALEQKGIRVRAPLAPNRRSPLHRAWYRARNDGAAFLTGYPRDYFYATPKVLADALESWTRETTFDVVVLEYWKLGRLAEHVASGRPVVLAHDAEFVIRERRRAHTEEGRRKLTAWRLMREARREIEVLRRTQTILALTDRDRTDLKRALGEDYPGEVRVLPVGTHIAASRQRAPEPDTVGFVGSFKGDFNVDALRHLLDEVWPSVRQRRPNARLLIAGGDAPDELRARGGKDGVTFLGFVEDLVGFIERVRAFAVPLRFGGGLRIRLLEALTVGSAVVSTPVGAAGLELTPGEHYLEAEDAADFADALVRVLEDDALWERLSLGGRGVADRRYGPEPVRQKTIALFEALAGRRSAA